MSGKSERYVDGRDPQLPSRSAGSRLAAATVIGCATLAAAAAGAAVSRPGKWYRELRKPAGTPPPGVFGPVWTALYAAMAYSAWRVWRRAPSPGRRQALTLWGAQLGLNAAWSPVFFGAHAPRAALGVIAALLPTLGAYTLSARKVDRWAGRLIWPYLGWTGYATYLNSGIARKN